MRSLLLLLALTASCLAAEPALTETPLTAVKGSMQIPQGWFVKEETNDGVTVYQITREKVESENDPYSAGIIVTVTTKVPDRANLKPSAYAAEMLANTQEDGSGELLKTIEGKWTTFRTEYQLESETGGFHVANYAKANDETGTLYFVTWQSPEAEDKALAPTREAVLSSLKFDPAF